MLQSTLRPKQAGLNVIRQLVEEYPELAKKQTKLATAKKSKKLEDEVEEEPEGAGYRRRR